MANEQHFTNVHRVIYFIILYYISSVVTVADNGFKNNGWSGPKRFRRAQVLTRLNLLNEEDSDESDSEDQEDASEEE